VPLIFGLTHPKPYCGQALLRKNPVGYNSLTGKTVLMQSVSKKVAWLSLLLTLWSAVAFAVHHHSSEDESDTCQVCVAAHSASPTTPSLAPKPVFRRVVTVRAQPAAAKFRLRVFALSVRPPPAV
jgi:hypothetical protein